MANVVPRREPCVKCNNPVFFAERLVIHESLYHRSCFRCARCNSVLTYGNFYETEKDHEYCCETCPDEEKKTRVDDSNRLSIAQKIALFEKESSSVLKKSLSDEEKSKSLSRPAKSEAFNNFLASQTTQEQRPDDNDEKRNESQSSESDSDDEDSNVPSITSKKSFDDVIPSISDKKITISDHKKISETPTNSVVTKELTHGKDMNAIAKVAETHSESHVKKDIISEDLVIVDSSTNESEPSPDDDDIELLFEQLAADAVKSPVVPIPVSPKISQIPIKQSVEQETKEKEPEVALEPLAVVKPLEIIVQEEASEDKPVNVESLPSDIDAVETENSTDDLKPGDTDYPENLDPFGDDEKPPSPKSEPTQRESLNPFGSCSEDEEEKENNRKPPPRPPLPNAVSMKAVSTNPFGSEDEEEEPQKLSAFRTPVPTPRKLTA